MNEIIMRNPGMKREFELAMSYNKRTLDGYKKRKPSLRLSDMTELKRYETNRTLDDRVGLRKHSAKAKKFAGRSTNKFLISDSDFIKAGNSLSDLEQFKSVNDNNIIDQYIDNITFGLNEMMSQCNSYTCKSIWRSNKGYSEYNHTKAHAEDEIYEMYMEWYDDDEDEYYDCIIEDTRREEILKLLFLSQQYYGD